MHYGTPRHQVDDDPRRRAVLEVSPTSALLPPNGRVPIEVTFCPREEKFHNFNLIFGVRKKQTKLSINVKGEGFKVTSSGRGWGGGTVVLRALGFRPLTMRPGEVGALLGRPPMANSSFLLCHRWLQKLFPILYIEGVGSLGEMWDGWILLVIVHVAMHNRRSPHPYQSGQWGGRHRDTASF